jgi:chaperonin GroEL (HSP60 family)
MPAVGDHAILAHFIHGVGDQIPDLAVVIGGELLKQAEDLLEQDVHPTVIAHGYRMAAEKAAEILRDMAVGVKANDTDMLVKIANTAMTGKGAEASKEKLNNLVVKAVTMVADEDGTVDIENVKVEKKSGGSVDDSVIIEGVLVDKERRELKTLFARNFMSSLQYPRMVMP